MSSDEPAEAARLLADEANTGAFLQDLESRYVTVEKERNELRLKAESLKAQLAESAAQLSSRDEGLRSMESKLAAAERDRQVFQDKCLTAQVEQKTQQERMDRIEAEADSLREEISRLTEANSSMTAKLAEAETKKVLSSSAAIPIQYELERVRKELDSLTSHNKWLETELTSKSNQLAECKTEHSKEIIELRTNLDKAVADRDVATSHEEALLRARDELQSKVDQLSNQLFQQEQETTDTTLSLKDELAAERRLVDLQKEQLERVEQRYNDVTKQAEQMREYASQAAAESRTEQERIHKEVLEECQRTLEQQAEDHRQQIKELEEQLEDANRRRIEAEDGLMASPPSRRRPPAMLTGAAGESTQDDQEPLGLTDLYARLSEREDELRVERTERRRLELFQQKILAEMQAKTPVLLRQRQEYELALEKYEESRVRLDEALEEMAAARAESSELRGEMNSMRKRSRELERENTDLAKQVQALLRSRAGGELESMSWNDAAGDDIPVCITIEEIQNQNQRLLREHRRLTDTVTELEGKLQTDPLRMQLEEAQKELSSLRQDRQRQEVLVAGIVQQRDLYRALLAKHDSSIVSGESAGSGSEDTTALILAQQKEKSKEIEDKNRQLEQDLAKVRADLSASERTKEALEDRLARYDVHSSELSTSVDRLQSQVSSANAAVARSEADASYCREKCVRLEESLQLSRAETNRANEAKKEMQSVNAELQQAVVVANAEAGKYEQELRQTSMKLRLAETKLETAKAAETRIALEANSLRSELARQGALLDSIQRIEASLSAKNEEDKEKLAENSERLSQTLAAEQSKHAVEIENHLSRIRELELQVKSVEEKKDGALSELVEAKKEALTATTEKQELLSKCSRLETELRSAKAKLGETDAEDEEEITMQARIETLTTELDSTRAELAASKERVTIYQNMAKASEDALADLNKAAEDYKRTQGAETEKLRNELASLQKESDAKQEMIGELTRDLANHRGEQEKIVSDLKIEIENWKEEVETATKDAESSAARLAALEADIASYRADATTAQNNYERELALHASARTALRSARAEADSEIRLRKIAEEQVESLKAEWAEERKVWEEEKTSLQEMMKEMEKSLEETRAQNDVLHSQLATLGDMVEKARSEKIAALSSSTSENTEAAAPTGESSEEMDNLRKLVSELRETVRFMRSEREAVQAQLDAARRTAERERAAYSVTKRSLEEARAELSLLQKDQEESRGGGTDVAEASAAKERELVGKLKQSEEQLTLLRESNKLLREEAETTQKSLASVQSELADLKKSVEPAGEKYRQLEVEKAALEAEKASLAREIDAWKGRVQSLVSKFHQIDPDEHEKVKKQVEELRKECDGLKSEKARAEKESASAKGVLSRLNKELSQQRSLVETQRKTIAKMSSEKEDETKSSKAAGVVAKERDQLKEEIQKMKSQAASKDTELKGAQQRNEKLMTHLRTFQKKIAEHRAKNKEQTDELAKMKAKEKEQEKELAQLKAKELEREKEADRPQPPTTQKESDQRVSQDSSSAPKAKITSAASTQASEKDDSKTIPRVPSGGFRFAPDEALASASPNQTSEMETSAKIESSNKKAVTKEEATISAPSTAVSGGEHLPSSSEPAATAGAGLSTEKSQGKPATLSESKKPATEEVTKSPAESQTKSGPLKRKAAPEGIKVESKKPALAVVIKPTADSKTISGPQKRKAASEGKKEELSIREKLMQKKRKLALELKKAKQESSENTEEKAELVDDKPGQSGDKSGELSADAKPWAPPTKISESAPMEGAESSAAKEKEKASETAALSSGTEGQAPTEGVSQKEQTASPVPEERPTETVLEPTDSAGVGEKEPASASAEKSGGSVTESKPAVAFGAKSPFGGSGFGTPSGTTPLTFGSSRSLLTKSTPSATAFGTKPAGDSSSSAFGSSFLDIKPPGSSSAPSFSFGSSATITLPTPSKALSPATATFGIFGQQKSASASNPFGGGASSQAKPLFGEASAKAPAAEDEEQKATEKETEGGQDEEETGEDEDSHFDEADV